MKNWMPTFKDIVYFIMILCAALSNYLIDKTESQKDINQIQGEITKINDDLKNTNLQLVVYRLDKLEIDLSRANDKISKIDEKSDRILILLAGR